MTRDLHDEARQLIALGGGNEWSRAAQSWLRAHLDECKACREYAEAAGQVVRAVRSLPVAADLRLVRATQMRVHFHSRRIREARERMWLVGIACVGVGLSASVTAPLLWRLFAWMGASAGLSAPLWQTGFALFWITPALLVSVLLIARGTHLANNGERSQQGR